MRLILFFSILCTGCSNIFLQPDRRNYLPKAKDHLLLEEGFVGPLHYWHVPAQRGKKPVPSQATIIQVHGNAQNLTAHVQSLGWLTELGYDLVIFDYRGFGQSKGKKDLDDAYDDVVNFLDFAQTKYPNLVFYGQSLGGTLLLKAVSSHPGRWRPKALVIESSFADYQAIAKEKLKLSWITWPLQWMAYLTVTSRYSLQEKELQTIAPIPVHMFYSEDDPIVPIQHGRAIFSMLSEPKSFHSYPERGHIAAMWVQEGRFRRYLLDEVLQK